MVFKCQNRDHYLYHFLPQLRISSGLYPEECRDERCPILYRVCKWVGEAGFKHSEQIDKMTGSYGMTYQIGWKGLLMLRFLTAKKKAGLFTRWKTKLSTEKLRKRYLVPLRPRSVPAVFHCRIPTPPLALLHLLKQNACCCCCFLHNHVNYRMCCFVH